MAASLRLETSAEKTLPTTTTKEKQIQQIQRAQWVRAAILGANDGLLSTAALMLGIGAARADQKSMIMSGLAGAIAGACSMAVGEFVSVSTQRDIERTMIEKCSSDGKLHREVGDYIGLHISTTAHPIAESGKTDANLAMCTVCTTPSRPPVVMLTCDREPNLGKSSPSTERKQGKISPLVKLACDREPSKGKISPSTIQVQSSPSFLSPSRSSVMKSIVSDARVTISQEAKQDDSKEDGLPNPYKAAAASALAFLCGSLVPIVTAMAKFQNTTIVLIMIVTSIALALFGGLGALLGGSPVRISAIRVLLGGWISMSITFGLLKAFDGHVEIHGDD